MTGVRTLFALAAGDRSAALSCEPEQIVSDLLGHRRSLFLRLIPRIFHTLAGAGVLQGVAERPAAELQHTAQSLAAHDLHQQQWLRRFLDKRRPAEIPVILLKGTAFAGVLYSADAPRLSLDIDLLVDPSHFQPMCEALSTEGELLTMGTGRRYTWSRLFEAVFRIPGNIPVLVEIHRDLTRAHQFRIDHDGLWERSAPSPHYQDPAVRQLSPEDTLLHLALHEFRHGIPQPHSYLDAFTVLERWNPDLDAAVELARRWGASTILYSLLRRVEYWFQHDIPHGVRQALEPAGWEMALLDRLFPCCCFEPVRETWPGPQRTASLALLDHKSQIPRFVFSYLSHRTADLALQCADLVRGAAGRR
jgi:hypothetical protein